MNQLITKDLTLDSREVADMVGKNHAHLLRDIDIYIDYLSQNPNLDSDNFFLESNYQAGTGKDYKRYQVTKKGCEFIAHKLTGQKGAEFTATYINRFHDMENKVTRPMSAMQLIELQLKAIKEVDEKVDDVRTELETFKKDMPLLGLECDRITVTVRTRGIKCMGGKESEAYQDKSLRGKIYADIYKQLKREFGIASYKGIKRNQCDLAVSIINKYELPIVLAEEVKSVNSQLSFI